MNSNTNNEPNKQLSDDPLFGQIESHNQPLISAHGSTSTSNTPPAILTTTHASSFEVQHGSTSSSTDLTPNVTIIGHGTSRQAAHGTSVTTAHESPIHTIAHGGSITTLHNTSKETQNINTNNSSSLATPHHGTSTGLTIGHGSSVSSIHGGNTSISSESPHNITIGHGGTVTAKHGSSTTTPSSATSIVTKTSGNGIVTKRGNTFVQQK